MAHHLIEESIRRYAAHVAAHPLSDKPFWQGTEGVPTQMTPGTMEMIRSERSAYAAAADDREWVALLDMGARFGVYGLSVG